MDGSLLAAGLGATAAIVANAAGSLISGWNERRLARDRELRQWRLEQLRPTLETLNRAPVLFAELDVLYSRSMRESDDEAMNTYRRKLRTEAFALQHLGHSLVIAREDADVISTPLLEAVAAYHNWFEEMTQRVARASVAHALGQPPVPISLGERGAIDRYLNSMLTLNQATERYAFGRVGKPILAELHEQRVEFEDRPKGSNGSISMIEKITCSLEMIRHSKRNGPGR